MWHSIVSNLDTALTPLIGGFITTCHQYPILTLCSLATFAILTAAFWLELLKIQGGHGGTREAPPIRLKR